MAGPSWLAGTLAAVMIATAAYCVSRMVAARRWRRPTDYDVDGVHMLMGVAMAGMLVPRLNPFPGGGWEVVFGASAAWFGWRAIRGYRGGTGGHRPAHHLPHLLASGAMLYMFLVLSAASTARGLAGTSMGGSSGTVASGTGTGFPALGFVLALALFGYVIWTTDRLTALAPVAAVTATVPIGTAPVPSRPAPVTAEVAAAGLTGRWSPAGPPMSQRLAACCDIAMGITMGYMLITML